MAININRVLLFAFASALLLALSAQVDSTPTISYISLAPDVAPDEVTKLPQGHGGAGEGSCQPENASSSARRSTSLRWTDDMKNNIDDVKSGDYNKASVDISAVSTNVDTCQDCYKEMMKEVPQVKKLDNWVLGIPSDSLAKLQKYIS